MLFTVGPCEMFESTKEIGGMPVPYFRNDEFSQVMFNCERLFKKHAYAADDDHFFVLTASGTGAMEATLVNCCAEGDKALVIVGGTFGKRFSEMCDILDIEHDDVVLSFGETLTPEHLAGFAGKGYTHLLVNLDETSTGQLYDLDMLSSFCKENELFLIVDAISAFGADHIDFGEAGIDALILSSQKALALPPGLSLVLVSARLYDSRVRNRPKKTMYFDYELYAKDMERGQTPFTPAVGIVLQLEDILKRIEADDGIEAWVERTGAIARDFRQKLASLPVKLPDFPLSNAVTPVIFESHDAHDVYRRLIDDYGFTVNPSGGQFASSMFRVAHIGNHSTDDNDALINALKDIL